MTAFFPVPKLNVCSFVFVIGAFIGGEAGHDLTAIQEQTRSLPVVVHHKLPGNGYTKDSPLYGKEQHWHRLREAGNVDSTRGGVLLVTPVSTSMKCIINLVTQYFAVYILHFIVATLNAYNVIQRQQEEKGLMKVKDTVFFVPMLCVLFLAARMHAVHLSQGYTEKYELPQWWVKTAMVFCSWSVLVLSVLVFLCTSIWGDKWEAEAKSGSLGNAARILAVFSRLTIFVIYVGFTAVCIGICTMSAPTDLWSNEPMQVSCPAFCTVLLSVAYFAIYLASACARAVNESGIFGPAQRFAPSLTLLRTATMTVGFSPMLCVLFIATRLRAMELDPQHADPPQWVQMFCYASTFSVLAQTVLAVIGSKIDPQGAQAYYMKKNEEDRFLFGGGTQTVDGSKPPRTKMGNAVEALRIVAMACLYVGVASIVIGLTTMKSTSSGSIALPTQITLQCIIFLTALYFGVYLALWVVITALRYRAPPAPENVEQEVDVLLDVRDFLESAKEAVAFCPMLCILFMGTSTRALQITSGTGAPQAWCQNFECLASACAFAYTFARFDTFLPNASKAVASVCTAIQYICLGVLYLSAAGVVVALLTMTPEQANGPGSIAFGVTASTYYLFGIGSSGKGVSPHVTASTWRQGQMLW